jgi:RNA polymerase sigma-70 factor (ECF subfamily)
MAEDILVETYTEVWRCAKKFKGHSRVTTWMMGIARNLAMNHLGKLRKHEDLDDFIFRRGTLDPEPMDTKTPMRRR